LSASPRPLHVVDRASRKSLMMRICPRKKRRIGPDVVGRAAELSRETPLHPP
jgi:hypothetical protein